MKSAPSVKEQPRGHGMERWHIAVALGAMFAAYGLLAYVILPAAWTHHEHQPGLAVRPMATQTKQGIPGDPMNVGVVGSRADAIQAMHAAGWYPADPITLRSSMAIIGSVIFHRPYEDAPVSNLYYDHRREDMAFEKPAGKSANARNHVRFWLVLEQGAEGRPVWLGAATFDRGVGISHLTGQVTHHIAPNIDGARSLLTNDLETAGMVEATYQVSGIGPTFNGRNGEGDSYYTDGEIWMSQLVPAAEKNTAPPIVLRPPLLVRLKDAIWSRLARMLREGPSAG
jgi:hypothetical protein